MKHIHSSEVKNRAIDLFFQIEKHILTGGRPLSFRDINKMLGLYSSASSQYYVNILVEWGLINRIPKSYRSITLAKTNYPPVEYRHIK